MFDKTKIITAAAVTALCLGGCSQSAEGDGSSETSVPAQSAPSPSRPSPPSPPPLQPDALLHAAGPGAEVKNNMPGDVLITAALPIPKDRGDYAAQGDRLYVDETAILAKRLAQAVQDGAGDLPQWAGTLSLVVLRPDVDRLGNPSAYSFMTLEFAVADLKAAKIKTLGALGVLDLATAVQVIEPWETAVKSWCEVHTSAPEFCLRARMSAGGAW